jgi:hypothetical protein
MSTVTPGTGGTIKSTTAEGQAHEILSWISLKQANSVINPAQAENVTGTHDQQALVFTGTYSFSVTQTIDSSGNLNLAANTYLVGSGFQVGTGGTFKGNSPEKYCLEVLMYLQSLEADATKNPNNRNFVTGTYNSDSRVYAGSFSLPVILGVDAGTGLVNYGANPYLL